MRRLVTALASLAVVFLLVPAVGSAIEPPVDNGVGVMCVFTSEDLFEANNYIENAAAFTTYHLYFVLYNPVAPSGSLGGCAFTWRMDPVPSPPPVFTSVTLPPNTINIGFTPNYEFIMGFGTAVPLVDGAATVVSLDIMFLANPGPTLVYLGPPSVGSLPGQMEYIDFLEIETIRPAYPNSVDGDYDLPVFGFNYSIPTENETWGGVKALFQ